jgi:hypothetical protein
MQFIQIIKSGRKIHQYLVIFGKKSIHLKSRVRNILEDEKNRRWCSVAMVHSNSLGWLILRVQAKILTHLPHQRLLKKI